MLQPAPNPIVRVSILRCRKEDFPRLRQMMQEAEASLRPGILAMDGLLGYWAGEDAAAVTLSNVSLWQTLAHAQQMDRFQPMLDLAVSFREAGATFERPIMNYATLWSFGQFATPVPRPAATPSGE
ncbi:MAG TPA: hypothetical protein VMU82_03970 [Acetobacteraceae bacterium]|nr:hypothetical protein [Acetobacteraceae bacterium]